MRSRSRLYIHTCESRISMGRLLSSLHGSTRVFMSEKMNLHGSTPASLHGSAPASRSMGTGGRRSMETERSRSVGTGRSRSAETERSQSVGTGRSRYVESQSERSEESIHGDPISLYGARHYMRMRIPSIFMLSHNVRRIFHVPLFQGNFSFHFYVRTFRVFAHICICFCKSTF